MKLAKLSEDHLADLARRSLSGNTDALEMLFVALLPRVRSLVRYLVRGDRDVDDLSQEALLTLLRGLGTYRGEGEFGAWADRVVARSVFAALRRQGAPKERDAIGPDELKLVGASRAPEAQCMRRELAACLDDLPESQRSALVRHHVLGMTVPEVSEELGVPEETVRSRLRLGKGCLKRLLGRRRY